MLYSSGMPLVYLCSTPWATSKQLLEDYSWQTPFATGKWGDLKGTDDPTIADIAVVFDSDPNGEALRFPAGKRIYMSREALDPISIREYPSDEYVHFSFWDGSGYLPVKWSYASSAMAGTGYTGLELSYDELLSMEPPVKTKKLACTLSRKRITRGHRHRLRFTKKMMNASSQLDVYGDAPFANMTLISNSKVRSLLPYSFQLTFDNQSHLSDFIGTQFTDSLLLWSKPLFWGSRDVFKYYPADSFTWFDIDKPKSEIPKLIELINSDDYQASLPAIAEARDKILRDYNFWPTLERVLKIEDTRCQT